MNKVIYRRKFQKTIRSSQIHKNIIWVFLSNGELLSMEFTQNEVIEKRHGIFDYKNVFITGNYFIFLKNNEITLYNQLIKGKKITVKLDCTPQKIIDVRGIIYILCETSVIE